jgi:hypothetical protein
MRSTRLRILSLILIGFTIVAGIVAGSMSTAYHVPAPARAPEPPPTTSVDLAESRPLSDQDANAITGTTKLSRSSSVARSKPQSLHFRGEYNQGKVCLPYGDDARSSATYELNSFRVIGLIRGSEMLQQQIENRPLTFEGIGRLKGERPGLVIGKTYTVRLVPSDETWKQIEKGGKVVMLNSEEMEVVPDPN